MRRPLRAAVLSSGIVLSVAGASVALARSRAPAFTPARESLSLSVPHLQGAITLDGDMDDTGWRTPFGRTGGFVADDGTLAGPYSDARFTWDSGFLYVALYASDENIRATELHHDGAVWLDDSFHLLFETDRAEYSFDVSARGVVTDGIRLKRLGERTFDFGWESDAHASFEIDGTFNRPEDHDEEWAIELAIPLESLGLSGRVGERVGVGIRRCDAMRDGARSCGTWGRGTPRGVLVFAPAVADESVGQTL